MSSSNPFLHNLPTAKKSIKERGIDILQGIVIFLSILVIIYLFLITPNQVDGESMYPNFKDQELLFTNRIIQYIGGKGILKAYNYEVGDVVVFQKPDHPDFIKRVLGKPGDDVMILDGYVYNNGKMLTEEYLDPDLETMPAAMTEGVEVTVPEGHYFLLGDNRNNSKDSRFSDIGMVDRKYIKGKVIFRWWPASAIGFIPRGEITYN